VAVGVEIHFCERAVAGALEVIAGIILAAGASRRMGTPKALLDYRGETFLARLVRVLGAVCDPVIVAVGQHQAEIRAQVRTGVQFVVNPDPERGQLSSLQTALAALPADAEGFVFTPVDSPAVAPETVELLATAFQSRASETLLVIPRYQCRKGHPVFAARSIANELLSLPPTAQAREVIRGHADRTLFVDVDDAGVLTDVDDPAAYRELTGSTR
jgi:CTP:molybdopterin cytidylyltransferase MocA